MKAVIGLLILGLCTASTDMAGQCAMAGFYLELGCSPVTKNGNPCPESFTCGDLHPDPTMCYYRGVAYGDRTTLPQSVVNNKCSQACSCRVGPVPTFECAAVDCVESFDNDMQECVSTYELDSCCSVGNVCGKDEIAKLKTCEVDGNMYKEGEYFEPKNTRKSCICTAQFNGSFDNPAYCQDINCGIEIHYQARILEGCAPVFVGDDKTGCPINFECPSPKSKIIRTLNFRNVGAQCKFGNMTLEVGDEMKVEDKCTECSCNVPPFVSCSKRATC